MFVLSRILARLDQSALAPNRRWGPAYLRARNALAGNSQDDCGAGNCVRCEGSLIQNSSISFEGSDNLVQIEEGVRLSNTRIAVRGSHCRLRIGRGCTLHKVALYLGEDESELTIGAACTASECKVAVTDRQGRVQIGANCIIALRSHIACGDGHTLYDIASREILNRAQYIEIEDGVWITAGCKILKNVRIGSGSIIATGSVVAQDIPANSVAVGNPARVIRSGVAWRRENIDRLPNDWFSVPAGSWK
jgi:acetyltransferase-like isoleucine patch superfamily enzyme